MTVIVVTGGRHFHDWEFVWDSLDDFESKYGRITVMVNGMAKGVDSHCLAFAEYHDIPVKPYPITPADWDEFGDSSGPRRNQQMIDENPDIQYGICFPGKSGTADMVRRLRKAGIERVLYSIPVSLKDEIAGWG